MSDTIAKIIGMLADDDAETRCAAAMVLARLRPLDDRAVAALRRGLREAPLHARSYFLDALAATRDPRVLPDLIDVLDTRGSVVDMAIGIARDFGGRAVDEIARRHREVEGWLNGAYIKAVAGVHTVKAAKMLIDRLPATDWEQARATSMFFNEHFGRYPESGQRYVRDRLRRYLDDDGLATPALITCLNLVRTLREDIDRDRLLVLAEGADSPSLRRHALAALEVLRPDLARLDDHRRRIIALADVAESDELGQPAIDLLAAWAEPPMAAEELLALAAREGRSAREWAFAELARRELPQAGPLLERELAAEDSRRAEAALRALVPLPGGMTRLLDVFLAAAEGPLRDRIGAALLEGELPLEEDTLRKLRRRYADSVVDESRFDAALLRLLGARDRDGLNATLIRRARKALAEGAAARAIALLQPLVRHRHGNEEARFVLALANLAASRELRRLDEPRTKRCLDILSPLSRTPGYDLARRLERTRDLGPVELLTILVGLSGRGRVERDLARRLLDRIAEDGLEDRDLRNLRHLREDLEARP
ncbi:MAG: hypothetical protein H6807_10160 [Planctomycetes bacterium]|nr:hypothetical protein [Planctomycetota bacterium]